MERVATTTDANGAVTAYEYTPTAISRKSRTRSAEYVYDGANRMVKGSNEKGEESHYIYNGLGVLVANEWVIEKNAYGYAGLDTTPSPQAEGVAAYCDRHSNTSGQGHINPTGNGHFKGRAEKPSIDGGKYAVVHKDYVTDYSKPYSKVLMEYEAGADGLTYRYTYGLEHATGALKSSAVISGIPNGAGSTAQSYHGKSVVKL